MRASTLGQRAQLEDLPAARALIQIGDPAVPTLVEILQNHDVRDRATAAIALDPIGSKSAVAALRDQLGHESDPIIKIYITKALEGK